MTTPAVQQALKAARANAGKKQVWLVYQFNDDDATVGTLWSNGTAQGEVYSFFSQAVTAYMKPVTDLRVSTLEQQFAGKAELIDATARESVAALDPEDRAKEEPRILAKARATKTLLVKEEKTAKFGLPKSDPAKGIRSPQEMGRQANDIAEFIRDCCKDFDPDGARHAEENFIRQFPSLVGKLGETALAKVDVYMNFSPCLEQSQARTIGDVVYMAGCMGKLKQLANAYNGAQWHVHYDEYFAAPDLDANKQACSRAGKDQPNVKMYKLVA